MRRLLIPALIAAALAPAATASAATLYVPDYNNDLVLGFNTQADGSLAPLAGSPFPTPEGGTIAFAMTPDGNRAVAGYLFNGGMRGFSIDPAGAIAPAQPKLGDSPELEVNSAAVSPDGRFAFFTTRTDAMGVRAHAIGATGALSEIAGSPFGAGEEHYDVAITPNGRFLFTTVAGGIARFAVGADGSLAPLGTFAHGGAEYLSTSPDGRFLFVSSSPGGGDVITSFTVGADGSLSQNGAAAPTGDVSAGIHGVSPDGAFVYAADSNSDTIVTLRVNPDGTLNAVGVPFAIEDVESLAVSPDGKFIYAQRFSGSAGVWVSPVGGDGRPVAFTLQDPVSPSTFARMAFRPSPAPVAEIAATPNSRALSVGFDAGASTIARGLIATFEWDFDGNGSVDASSAVADHRFSKPGVYNVTLRLGSDRGGCPDRQVYLGQSTFCSDPASATRTISFDTPPWITSLKVSPRTVGSKTKIRFKLTERARVTFFAERKTTGRLVGGKCRKATRSNRRAKRCTLWVRASKSFRKNGKAGSNSLKFNGRVGGRRLPARSYRINAVAVDSAKGKSPVKTAPFRIK